MPTATESRAPVSALPFTLEEIVRRSQNRLTVAAHLLEELEPLTYAQDGRAGRAELPILIETIEWCVAAVLEDLKPTETWDVDIQNYSGGPVTVCDE